MTCPRIDVGKDRHVILWQRHLLTDVLMARGASVPTCEPVLCPPEDPAAAMFKVLADERRVAWDWGAWKSLEITAINDGQRYAPLKFFPPQLPEVGWDGLPACDAAELAFYDAGNQHQPCGAVKVGAPGLSNFGRDVSFQQPHHHAVVVKLSNKIDGANAVVRMLEPSMTVPGRGQTARTRNVIGFARGTTELRLNIDRWAGIIAVVNLRPGHPRLLGYVNYNGERMMKPNLYSALGAAELRNVRRWVGEAAEDGAWRKRQEVTLEEWLDDWPERTKADLGEIARQARVRLNMNPLSVARLLPACPAGLSRYLALSLYGYTAQSPEQSIRRLNEGSFEAALGTLLPRLSSTLTILASPEEQGWAIGHANNPWLEAAAEWAAGEGEGGLSRALHLLEKRAEAVDAWEARSRRRTLLHDREQEES